MSKKFPYGYDVDKYIDKAIELIDTLESESEEWHIILSEPLFLYWWVG